VSCCRSVKLAAPAGDVGGQERPGPIPQCSASSARGTLHHATREQLCVRSASNTVHHVNVRDLQCPEQTIGQQIDRRLTAGILRRADSQKSLERFDRNGNRRSRIDGGGDWQKRLLMLFLVSLIAYAGAVIGIGLALLLPLCALFSAPGQSTALQQTVVMAPRAGQHADKTNIAIKMTTGTCRGKPRVAPTFFDDRLHLTNDASRKTSLYMLARQKRTPTIWHINID
jgi:hypothetical protein